MKEIIARTQKEWQKLRRILAQDKNDLPQKLPKGKLAAALIPGRGENAVIIGSYIFHDEVIRQDRLFIEWQRVAEKTSAPSIAFIDDKGALARFLKVFNPAAPGS